MKKARKPFDETDKKLISLLYKDGRSNLTDLSKKLGISHVAVRKRLNRLVESNLLKIRELINLKKISARIVVFLVEVKDPKVMIGIRKMLKDCPRVLTVLTLMGRCNLLVLMIAEDEKALESMASICCLRRAKGIEKIEVMISEELVMPEYFPVKIRNPELREEKPPCGLVNCITCPRFKEDKCPGCPAIKYYRGIL